MSVWLPLFLVVMVCPCLAVGKFIQGPVYPYALGYLAVISLLTWFVYRADKRKARKEAWRTPESSLHLLELAGGWPAAYWAQRVYRHKIRKFTFQMVFWFIAALHQYLAVDYLMHHKLSFRLNDIAKAFFANLR